MLKSKGKEILISTEENNDDENAEENEVLRPEQTQVLSMCFSGVIDKYTVNVTLVKTMVFPTQVPILRMTALIDVDVNGWG